jgi:hypothetical protein
MVIGARGQDTDEAASRVAMHLNHAAAPCQTVQVLFGVCLILISFTLTEGTRSQSRFTRARATQRTREGERRTLPERVSTTKLVRLSLSLPESQATWSLLPERLILHTAFAAPNDITGLPACRVDKMTSHQHFIHKVAYCWAPD